MKDDIWECFEVFICQEFGWLLFGGKLNFQLELWFEEDFGVIGFDGVEFIDKWVEIFNVDVEGFLYWCYFGLEGQELLLLFIGLFVKWF